MHEPSLAHIVKVIESAAVLDQKDTIRGSISISAEVADLPDLLNRILASTPVDTFRKNLPIQGEPHGNRYRYSEIAMICCCPVIPYPCNLRPAQNNGLLKPHVCMTYSLCLPWVAFFLFSFSLCRDARSLSISSR